VLENRCVDAKKKLGKEPLRLGSGKGGLHYFFEGETVGREGKVVAPARSPGRESPKGIRRRG